jgi:hypothetical protein
VLPNAVPGLGKSIEVINAGIPGYTTYQELEFLKVYGLDMKPDLGDGSLRCDTSEIFVG